MERITNQSSESERRQATILFADISGFTAMSEKMDPEEVTSVMNSIFHLMEITIKQNGGHIDKFMGDCVMALFGAPSALENAPFMGVKTAIELRKLVYQYNADNKLVIPLDIHIGINTGSVVAGNVGGSERKDYTVMGDTVNLASRIESTAERGQILVGPETFKAVHKEIDFQVLKPISLKGKSEPIVLYEVLGIITEKNITDRSIFSRLVGRDEEMAILHHQVEKLINGKGGIISISGEAGIGKSRLMAEFKNGPLMKQTVLFEGRAISMGRSLSFYPIIDCLKHWAGIKEEDGDKEKLSKLANAVINQCPQEADEIIAFTARLMSIELTENYENIVKGVEGETLEKLIVKNIQKILIEGSIIQPLVLCLEDLHWADASSLAMLEQLFRLADKERILFILLFRPDYPETSGAILKILSETHHEYHIPITIEPLSVIETGILISNLLNIKGLPQILEKQIKERSGGNPFFIEEILRSFIDEGAVIKKGSGYEVTDKIGKVTVPFTVNEVLMSRIDRLDEQTKNVIKTASVIGRNFFYKILSNIAVNIPDLDSRLTLLEEMQFIHEKKRLDEVEFIFKHALAQEAAYESLLNQKRKEIFILQFMT